MRAQREKEEIKVKINLSLALDKVDRSEEETHDTTKSNKILKMTAAPSWTLEKLEHNLLSLFLLGKLLESRKKQNGRESLVSLCSFTSWISSPFGLLICLLSLSFLNHNLFVERERDLS